MWINSSANKIKTEDGLDHVLLFVIDILNEEATFVSDDEEAKNIVSESFNSKEQDGNLILPGIVSRKKQIIPGLSK